LGRRELRQYDVSDPFNPRLTGTVRLGGIMSKAAHPKGGPLAGGPQMVVTAWIVYAKLGLMVLRQGWLNFDLIWSVALFVVGGVALMIAI
jgi:hypothetical protein